MIILDMNEALALFESKKTMQATDRATAAKMTTAVNDSTTRLQITTKDNRRGWEGSEHKKVAGGELVYTAAASVWFHCHRHATRMRRHGRGAAVVARPPWLGVIPNTVQDGDMMRTSHNNIPEDNGIEGVEGGVAMYAECRSLAPFSSTF